MVHKWMKRVFQQTFKGSVHSDAKGYLLPAVIALGLGVGTISIYSLQSVAQNSGHLNDQYYSSVAREAAQAGIAAVKACTLASTTPNWGVDSTTFPTPTNPLKPNIGCNGQADTSGTRSPYVSTNSTLNSYFEVTEIKRYPGSSTGATITSRGVVEIKGPSGTKVNTVRESVRALVTSSFTPTGPQSKPLALISTNSSTTCAATTLGEAFCWGDNSNRQLGNSGSADSSTVVAVDAEPYVPPEPDNSSCGGWFQRACYPEVPASPLHGKKVTKISVGSTHTCAIAADDMSGTNARAYCWGNNSKGQLGDRSTSNSSRPVAVAANAYIPPEPDNSSCGGFLQRACRPAVPASVIYNKTIIDITAGDEFTCALTSEHKVVCWGDNSKGQLATGTNKNDSDIPVAVSEAGPEVINHPASGCGLFGCSVPAWTENFPASALAGKQVKALAEVKGAATMCAITTDDKTVCWGENFAGQVGDGDTIRASAYGYGHASGPRTPSCQTAVTKAYDEARSDLGRPNNVRKPSEVQTTLKFDSLKIVGDYTGDYRNNIDYPNGTSNSTLGADEDGVMYAYVIAKASTAASNPSPQRLYYWGGSMTWSNNNHCDPGSSSSHGNDHMSYGSVTMRRAYAGVSVPTGPIYNDANSGGLQSQQIGFYSGNPITGLFCAKPLANPNIYCDGNGIRGRQGQLGNGSFYSCTGWNCTPPAIPTIPQLVYNTPTAALGTAWLQGKTISALDTSVRSHTCVIANQAAYCWGLNSDGQLGDKSTNNRAVPTEVDYRGTAMELPSGSAGTPIFDVQVMF